MSSSPKKIVDSDEKEPINGRTLTGNEPESSTSSSSVSDTSDSSQPNSEQGASDTQVDVKELAFKRFLYMEAGFRYQEMSPNQHLTFPRSTQDKSVTFRDILSALCPDVLSGLTGKVFMAKRSDSGVSSDVTLHTDRFIDNTPFAFLFHANGDGTSTVYDESVNLSLEYTRNDQKKQFVSIVIKPLGSTEFSVYARLSLMLPHEGTDDLQTLNSKSLPMAASCILVFDVLDPSSDLKRYEELERVTIEKVNQRQQLEPLEDELMRGMSGINYPGYNMAFGKWLLDQNRYYDAYVTFERAYNCLRVDLSHLDKDGQSAFYRACYAMGFCLKKMGFLDKASYYLQLAINGGEEYIGPYVEALAVSSHNRVCLFLNQLRRQVAQNQSAAAELQRLEKVVADAENSYRVPETFDFSELPLGYVLHHIYDVEPRCVLGATVCPFDGGEDSVRTLLSSDDIFNLNLYSLRDSLVYVRYTRAGWEMGNEEDKSVLCQNNCIIFNIHTVTSEDGKAYLRINTMLPNFSMNDEKRIPGPFNLPKGASLILGLEGADQKFTNKELDDIFKIAVDYRSQHRILEAMRAFEFIHRVLKIEYTKVSATEETEELFFEATHQLGYALSDLALYDRATYYLDWAQEGYKADYAREYVNCLCHNHDIRALNVIENLIVNMQKPSEPDFLESYQYFQSFLQRRKAYVLMDRRDFDEAEKLLKELLNDPLSKDYAQQELDFLSKAKQ